MCGLNIVQDIGTSCGKIPSQDEEGIRVGCLLFTDVLVEFVQCFTPVVGGAGRDVYSCQQNSSTFPEWPELNNHQFVYQWL